MKAQNIDRDVKVAVASVKLKATQELAKGNYTIYADLMNKLSKLTSLLIEETDKLIENVSKSG